MSEKKHRKIINRKYTRGMRCPKCKKGCLRHRDYSIYDCDNVFCGQTYILNEVTETISEEEK
jgi:ribosomal protein L37AE/L43A